MPKLQEKLFDFLYFRQKFDRLFLSPYRLRKKTSKKKEQSATVPKDVYCYRYCFLETKECMHNEVGTCAEILPFLFPFCSKFSDLNFASYVLYIYLHTVSLGYLWLYLDRKWPRNANDPHFGPQMISKKGEEWHGGWNGVDRELMWRAFIFIKITLNSSHRFLSRYSFPERLNFVSYHAVINLPHLIIGWSDAIIKN